jgi:hypothetical protein
MTTPGQLVPDYTNCCARRRAKAWFGDLNGHLPPAGTIRMGEVDQE